MNHEDPFFSLCQEQAAALAMKGSPYLAMFRDAAPMARVLAASLVECHAKLLTKRRGIERALAEGPLASSSTAHGRLQRFAGSWKGIWTQEGTETVYEHQWGQVLPFEPAGATIYVQKVIMMEVSTGIRNLAVNTIHVLAGRQCMLTGFVAPSRPHVGFLVEPDALFWLAREGSDRHSAYYEEANDDEYQVWGLDFTLDRVGGPHGPAELIDVRAKSGCYRALLQRPEEQRPPLQSESEEQLPHLLEEQRPTLQSESEEQLPHLPEEQRP